MGAATGGFQLVGAVDINSASLATYAHNFGVTALHRDIRDLATTKSLREKLLTELPTYDPAKPLVLIGCAPCQGFTAHRKRRWNEVDARNSLVDSFAQVAAELAPDCIVMENVPELLSGRYWPHFEAFRDRLHKEGYTVKQAIHNSAGYGVPQERFRALIVAMKTNDFSLPQPWLTPEQFKTVRDAIGGLPPVRAGEQSPEDPLHKSASHRKATIEVIRAVPKNGGSRPPGIGPVCLDKVKGFYDVYGRLSWDKPAITITHYARNPASGRFVHPEQDRGLTTREAARLQGFPDGFEFIGSFDDRFRQIGEAVPPPVAVALAGAILANFRGEQHHSDENLIDTPVNDSFAGVIAGLKRRPL